MLKVIVNGAKGKMGVCTVEALTLDNRFTLVQQCDRNDDLAACIKDSHADIVIDFTPASQGMTNATTIIESGARAVIGTSGFLPQHVDTLTTLCQKHARGCIIAPNFSIGAILMMHCAKLAAPHMSNTEIIELHHDQKIDAPSGTALKTADMIAESQGNQPLVKGDELLDGARGADHHGIPIHSIRLPGIIADQTVIMGAPGETFTIKHNTTSRTAFMPGVLLACEQVMHTNQLVYGLEKLLFPEG
jgi:4-hydroxy-tetrahydrodipicolinate reductase